MRKRKNEPIHLKDSFLHLKTSIHLKFALDILKSTFFHTRRRTRKMPFSILYISSPSYFLAKEMTLLLPMP